MKVAIVCVGVNDLKLDDEWGDRFCRNCIHAAWENADMEVAPIGWEAADSDVLQHLRQQFSGNITVQILKCKLPRNSKEITPSHACEFWEEPMQVME